MAAEERYMKVSWSGGYGDKKTRTEERARRRRRKRVESRVEYLIETSMLK